MNNHQVQALLESHHSKLLKLVDSIEKGPGFSWSLEKIQDELKSSEAWGWWVDGELRAFVLWREGLDVYEIMALGTAPEFRQKGAMKSLLLHLIAGCQKAVWLEVHELNSAAIKLYQHLGFQPSGIRKNYYSDGASAVLMSLIRKDF